MSVLCIHEVSHHHTGHQNNCQVTWVFLEASLTFKGDPGNIQGNFTALYYYHKWIIKDLQCFAHWSNNMACQMVKSLKFHKKINTYVFDRVFVFSTWPLTFTPLQTQDELNKHLDTKMAQGLDVLLLEEIPCYTGSIQGNIKHICTF